MPGYWRLRSKTQLSHDQLSIQQQREASAVSNEKSAPTSSLRITLQQRPSTSAGGFDHEQKDFQDRRLSHKRHESESGTLALAESILQSTDEISGIGIALGSPTQFGMSFDKYINNLSSTTYQDGSPNELLKSDLFSAKDQKWAKVQKYFQRPTKPSHMYPSINDIGRTGSVRYVDAIAPGTVLQRGPVTNIVVTEQKKLLDENITSIQEEITMQTPLPLTTDSDTQKTTVSIVDMSSPLTAPAPDFAMPSMERRAASPSPSAFSQSSARYTLFPKLPPLPRQRSATLPSIATPPANSLTPIVDGADEANESDNLYPAPRRRQKQATRSIKREGQKSKSSPTSVGSELCLDVQALRQTKSLKDLQSGTANLPQIPLKDISSHVKVARAQKARQGPTSKPVHGNRSFSTSTGKSTEANQTIAIVEKLTCTLSTISAAESKLRSEEIPRSDQQTVRAPYTVPSVQLHRQSSSTTGKAKEMGIKPSAKLSVRPHAGRIASEQPLQDSKLEPIAVKHVLKNERKPGFAQGTSAKPLPQPPGARRFIIPLSRYAPAHTSADLSRKTGFLPVYHQRSQTEPVQRAPSSRALFLEALPIKTKSSGSLTVAKPPAPVSKTQIASKISVARKISVSREPSVTKVEIRLPRLGGVRINTNTSWKPVSRSSSADSIANEPVTPASETDVYNKALPQTPLFEGHIRPRKPALRDVGSKHKPGNSMHIFSLLDLADNIVVDDAVTMADMSLRTQRRQSRIA